jgi:glycosyltransferase involved in cell wall biosynthesis
LLLMSSEQTGTSSASPRPLRILHLGSPTGLYGAERWILALVRHLPRDRVHSTVAVIKDDPSLEAPLRAEAARMGLDTAVFESHGKLSWSAIGQLRRFVRQRGIDIIHSHGYKTDIISLLATRGTGCRNVSTPHGWSVKAGLKLRIYETLDRVAFLGFDAVVPLSDDLYAGLEGIPGMRKRLHLVRNGVDLEDIDQAVGTPIQPDASGATPTLVGYIGQLIPRKGLEVLLEAFQRVHRNDLRLIIVGDGPQRVELEARAASTRVGDSIHFLGFRDDRLALLKQFAFFVLPSRLEGIPRCLMEAMATGVPVIASDIPGCRDIVAHQRTGLLFPVDDSDALAAAIKTLADSPEERKRLAANGRAHVRAEYSAETMANRYLVLYERVVNGG